MQTGTVLSATGPFSLLNLPKLLRFAILLENNILAIGKKFQSKGTQWKQTGPGYSLTRKPIRKYFTPWCLCIFCTCFCKCGHVLYHTIRIHKSSNLFISRMVPWPFKLRLYLMKNRFSCLILHLTFFKLENFCIGFFCTNLFPSHFENPPTLFMT